MGKIITIGGGEIGKTKVMPNGTFKTFPIQTMEIDMALVQMANKPQPKVLFLPTASQDNPSYIQLFYQYYGDKLGCLVDLRQHRRKHTHCKRSAVPWNRRNRIRNDCHCNIR